MNFIAAADPWTLYPNTSTTSDAGNGNAWGKKPIHPTPEPATYGLMFMGLCLLLLGWQRFRR